MPAMMKMLRLSLAFGLALVLASPAFAIVGGKPGSGTESVPNAVVTIVGSRGNFCSGTLIAPSLILTAAHCVLPGADYKVVRYRKGQDPELLDIRRVARHPQYNAKAITDHRASADVALVQLLAPMPERGTAPFGPPVPALAPGQMFIVAGAGVEKPGDGRSGGTVRIGMLTATGQPGNLQLRLAGPGGGAAVGACTGDSGGPVAQLQNGRMVVVAVISWSTGPGNSPGCGGLTGATPLTLYRDWIVKTARDWGIGL